MRRLTEQVERFDTLVTRTRQNLERLGQTPLTVLNDGLNVLTRNLSLVADRSLSLARDFSVNMRSMVVAVDAVTASLASMTAAAAAAAAGGTAAGGGAVRGGRHGGGGGGIGMRSHSGPFYVHSHFGPLMGAGLGAAAGAFLGLREAGGEQYAIARAVQLSNIDPNSARGIALQGRLSQQAAEISFGSIYSRRQVAETFPEIMGLIGATNYSPEQIVGSGLLKPLTRFAEYEQLQGLGTSKDAALAGMRFAHLMQVYDPAKLTGALNQFAALTVATQIGPRQLEKTEQYAIPVARGLGMQDPTDVARLVGLLSILGQAGTSAGTGLARVLIGAFGQGTSASTQSSIQTMERELFGTSGRSGGRSSAHLQALEALGILDASGHPVPEMRKGGINMSLLMQRIQTFGAAHPDSVFGTIAAMSTLWGARSGSLLATPSVAVMDAALQGRVKGFPGTVEAQQQLVQATFFGQLERSWADIRNLLNVLTGSSLPALVHLLNTVNNVMDRMLKWLDTHQEAAGKIGLGMEVGGSIAAVSLLMRLLGLGSIGGAIGGIARGAGALVGGGAVGGTIALALLGAAVAWWIANPEQVKSVLSQLFTGGGGGGGGGSGGGGESWIDWLSRATGLSAVKSYFSSGGAETHALPPGMEGLVMKYESGGRNIHNPFSTASGYFQFLNSTWHRYADPLGFGNYATAMDAPFNIQEQVFKSAFAHEGINPWISNSRLMGAIYRGEGLNAALPSGSKGSNLVAGGAGTTIHLGGVHVHGDIDNPSEKADKLLDAVNQKLRNSHLANQGEGDGTLLSPWTAGLGGM